MSETKFLTLPTTLGDVTLELRWDALSRGFERENGLFWYRFHEEEIVELARKHGLAAEELKRRLGVELDLEKRLA